MFSPLPWFHHPSFFHEGMEVIVNYLGQNYIFFMPPFSPERHSKGEGFYSKNTTVGLLQLWYEQGFSESVKGNVADSTLTLETVAPELQLPLILLCWIKTKHDVDFVCKRSRLWLCWDPSKSWDRTKALKEVTVMSTASAGTTSKHFRG